METISAILIITPVLMPVTAAVGIDPVHLGVVMILNLMVGLLTPPIGMCLFAVAKVARMPLDRLIKAIIPFYIPILVTLLLLVLFPQIVLFLPNLFF
jgi:TRAP-type C4-dicarboxylate transport system permease large subunit